MAFLEIQRKGAIVIVTMNAPQQSNALTEASQFQELFEVIDDVAADKQVKVMVLTGAGRSFCAGGNVKDMHEKQGVFAGNPYEISDNYRASFQMLPKKLVNLDVPVIAAINGHAIGAGLDLTCMCDIRIASERATFAESFVSLGIIPGDGGAWLLPRVIGHAKASLMALTGDRIDAAQALAWGLVTEVVADDKVLEHSLNVAERIAKNSGPALRMTKRLLRESQHARLEPILDMSAAFQGLAHHTEEHRTLVADFIAAMANKSR